MLFRLTGTAKKKLSLSTELDRVEIYINTPAGVELLSIVL